MWLADSCIGPWDSPETGNLLYLVVSEAAFAGILWLLRLLWFPGWFATCGCWLFPRLAGCMTII